MSKKNDLEHTSTMLGSQNMKSSQRMVSVVESYELPEGWKWCRLGDVCRTFSDGDWIESKDQSTEGIRLIQTGNIGKGTFRDKDDKCRYISENTFERLNCTEIFAGDILISRLPEPVGRACIIPQLKDRMITAVDCAIVRLFEGAVEKKWFCFYTQSHVYDGLVKTSCTGTTRLRISRKNLGEIPFPLPPTLAEQQRIVKRIESMFAKLDEAKEKAQNVVDGFETRKAAILHKAFTGELTAKWRKENGIEKNKELDFIYNFAQTLSKKDMTNITDFQKQAYDYVLSDGAVWKKCCIGAIGVITNGSTPSRKEASFWNGNIPWVSSGEVANNTIESTNEMISEEGFNNSSVKKLPIGTVLIAMIGEGKTRGQTSVLNIEATTNQNIAAIIINHGHVESKFLWYWLQKEYKNNRTAGNGSGPQALNCQKVRELPFILPTLPEQVEIIRILDIIIEKENKAKQAAEAVLEQIDLLKKSILARAFRGEL